MVAEIEPVPGRNTQRAWWLGDFRYQDGYIIVKSTGVWMKNDLQLWGDIRRWLTYYAFVRLRGWWAGIARGGPRIYFTPDQPRPWYVIWSAAVWGGARFAASPQNADAAFYFEDQTVATPPRPPHARAFNFDVGDVSKSKVAKIMEAAFGYPLAIDPTTHAGEAVEKSEGNGLHDGKLVTCPMTPVAGKAYQRLIKTEAADGWAYDLRTVCVGRRPVVIFLKRKPAAARFSIQNSDVVVKAPQDVFSAAELTQLEKFCAEMQLDWGGIDVLRDHASGRLYVVDVNKTDTGPAVLLNWADRAKATQMLADALLQMIRNQSLVATTPTTQMRSTSA